MNGSRKRPNIDRKDTPLIAAIRQKDNERVRSIIQGGCDIEEQGREWKSGWRDTPLIIAIDVKNHFAFDELIQAGCDIKRLGGIDNNSPLMEAVNRDNKIALRKLIRLGCDVNESAYNGPPVTLAMSIYHYEVMWLLLESGADIAGQDGSGDTILHQSAREATGDYYDERWKRLQQLVDFSKDTAAMATLNANGESPLVTFIIKFGNMSKYHDEYTEHYERCVGFLASDSKAVISPSWTLALAIENAPLAACETIINSNPSCVNMCFPDGESPLHCAVRLNSIPKCKLLIDHGALLKLKWQGVTPLELALSLGCDAEVIRLVGGSRKQPRVSKKCCFKCFTAPLVLLVYLQGKLGASTHFKCFSPGAPRALLTDLNRNLDGVSTTELRAILGTDIPFQHQVNNDELLIALIASAHKVNSIDERTRLLNFIQKLFQEISDNLSRDSETKHFRFHPKLTGSMKEGTKTFTPDEVDAVCEFVETDISIDCGHKDVRITVESHSSWPKVLNGKRYEIRARTVADIFYTAFRSQIQVMRRTYSENDPNAEFCIHSESLQIKDKISCLQILWRSNAFGHILVNVDVVPAFLNSAYTPKHDMRLPNTNITRPLYHCIPKLSRRVPHEAGFHVSHTFPERDFMEQLPNHIIHGFIIAKALRISAIAQPSDVSFLAPRETLNIEDYVTSYMLKTCLIYIRREMPDFDGTVVDWADRIYEYLHQKAKGNTHKHKAILLSHYYDQEALLYCDDVGYDPMRPCCIKRLMIIGVCESVRAWLIENGDTLRQACALKGQ